jgi:hypothetical protein
MLDISKISNISMLMLDISKYLFDKYLKYPIYLYIRLDQQRCHWRALPSLQILQVVGHLEKIIRQYPLYLLVIQKFAIENGPFAEDKTLSAIRGFPQQALRLTKGIPI